MADGDPAVSAAGVADNRARYRTRNRRHTQDGRSRSLRAGSLAADRGAGELSGTGCGGGLDRPGRRAAQGCHRGGRVYGGDVTTRAAVSARTSRTPACLSTRAHAFSVAPVVLTSSTSTTTSPSSLSRP